MAWTTITDAPEDIDEEIADFASGVTSIDAFSVTHNRPNEVVALIEYSP